MLQIINSSECLSLHFSKCSRWQSFLLFQLLGLEIDEPKSLRDVSKPISLHIDINVVSLILPLPGLHISTSPDGVSQNLRKYKNQDPSSK